MKTVKSSSAKTKGIFWIFGWLISFTTAMTFTKFLSPGINSWTIVLMRSFFGLLYIAPFLFKQGVAVLRTDLPLLQLLRVCFSSCAVACTYYAYQHLPLAIATSIGLTSPLIVPLFSVLILKERIPSTRWIAICVGYIGVLCIVRPTIDGIHWAMGIAIIANLLAASSIVLTKILSKTESTHSLLLNSNLALFVIAFVVNLFCWEPFTLQDGIILGVIAAAGLSSQFCSISALRLITPSFMAPFEYSRLLFALSIDFLLFNQLPTEITLFGSFVIVIASYFVVQSKNREQSVEELSIVKERS